MLAQAWGVIRQAWRDLLNVYYTNTPVWRWLKSGALLIGGFGLWSASALLMSYRPDWTWLTYAMAYGFVLILWGPLTHFVVVPLIIRLRRTARHPVTRLFARQGSKINLAVFFALVLILGAVPIGPMMLDFQGSVSADGPSDVDPDVACEVVDEEITCHVEDVEGIDHVVVLSGDREIARDDDPPYELTFETAGLEEAVGQYYYTIEVRDEDGQTLRRYSRTAPAN